MGKKERKIVIRENIMQLKALWQMLFSKKSVAQAPLSSKTIKPEYPYSRFLSPRLTAKGSPK